MSIIEVSKLAGVSTATVSRVINDYPKVAPQTVRVVRQAMATLGYTPPPPERRNRRRRASGGPSGATGTGGARLGRVVLLFPDHRDQALRTALSGRLMHGVNDRLAQDSLQMIVSPLMRDGTLPASLTEHDADGVIVRGATDLSAVEGQLKATGLPVVWLLETGEGLPRFGDQVLEDTDEVGRLAAEHLVSTGRRRLVVLNDFPSHPAYPLRTRAFMKWAKQMGAECTALEADTPMEALTRRVLGTDGKPRFDGVFVPSPDDFIGGAYRGLRACGLTPGRDLGFIACSYDPDRLAALDPALPNVDVQAESMATAAVETLLWRLGHRDAPRRRVMLSPRLVIPAESGRAAESGRYVDELRQLQASE